MSLYPLPILGTVSKDELNTEAAAKDHPAEDSPAENDEAEDNEDEPSNVEGKQMIFIMIHLKT